MSKTPGIILTGASGRMGQMLARSIAARGDCHLAGALERSGHGWIGRDLGAAMGGAALGVRVSDDPAEAFANGDALIDFTAPAATLAFARHAAEAGLTHVIGTTGFTDDDLAALAAFAPRHTQIRAGNMSLGVNLLTQLTQQVAAALGVDYDIEIIEAHHRHKVDAPSGTALMLGEAAAQGRGIALAEARDSGRDGITSARQQGAIGFSAIRGGDIIGEHDVMFAGPGERITLRHVASDRSVFANGAIRAALWGLEQGPGAFDMIDVLGLPRA